MAIEFFKEATKRGCYVDFKNFKSKEEYLDALSKSSTVYVGNLTFTVDSESVTALFERVGPVRRVIMGINPNNMTPCGFCFVEYVRRADALAAVASLSGVTFFGRPVQVDIDPGFREGRQFGRGSSGNQSKDDRMAERKSFPRATF